METEKSFWPVYGNSGLEEIQFDDGNFLRSILPHETERFLGFSDPTYYENGDLKSCQTVSYGRIFPLRADWIALNRNMARLTSSRYMLVCNKRMQDSVAFVNNLNMAFKLLGDGDAGSLVGFSGQTPAIQNVIRSPYCDRALQRFSSTDHGAIKLLHSQITSTLGDELFERSADAFFLGCTSPSFNRSLRILLLVSSMEALVLKGSQESIQANLANKGSHLLYNSGLISETKSNISTSIKRMYDVRSVAAHNKQKRLQDLDSLESECRLYSRTLLTMYLSDKGHFNSELKRIRTIKRR